MVNYHIEGTHDDGLWLSDWWYLDSAGTHVDWYPPGFLYFHNATGHDVDIIMEWHLGNICDPNLVKHIWIETIEAGTSSADVELIADPGYEVRQPDLRFSQGLPDLRYTNTWYAEIIPNPQWEIIRWTFHLGLSDEYYIDEVHVATECVLEPGTVALFSLGLLGLGARLRRRKQR